jgi:hypothetical protein
MICTIQGKFSKLLMIENLRQLHTVLNRRVSDLDANLSAKVQLVTLEQIDS